VFCGRGEEEEIFVCCYACFSLFSSLLSSSHQTAPFSFAEVLLGGWRRVYSRRILNMLRPTVCLFLCLLLLAGWLTRLELSSAGWLAVGFISTCSYVSSLFLLLKRNVTWLGASNIFFLNAFLVVVNKK